MFEIAVAVVVLVVNCSSVYKEGLLLLFVALVAATVTCGSY